MKMVELAALILKYQPPLVAVGFMSFLFLVSTPVTVTYNFTAAPIFAFLPTHSWITQNLELISTRQTLKKHTLMRTQHLKSYHMHCIQINYYTIGTLMQALIQFSCLIEVRLNFVKTVTSSFSLH